MKLQLANYRSCLLLCVPFNSFLPSKRLALSFESRIDIKGETLPFIIHGASSTHWRVETEEKSSAGGLTCLWGLGVPAHLTRGGSAEVTAGWHRTGLKPIWHSLTDVKSITPVISLREALREPVPQGSNNSFTH